MGPVKPDAYAPAPETRIEHPEWSVNATIYQINTRQFTPEGTFRAATEHLPRLKDLGVTILWLMPIHPIGVENRKGGLGSPYAVRDYYGVNEEFGTLEDLKAFVDAAHEQGFKVILDWVANHTAWDNVLVTEHPEWYARDYKGDFSPTPWWDWDDIIDLDYSSRDLREYMTRAMRYWVEDVDVDGFRCDVAGFVPTDFWDQVRAELDTVKPVFMLAEWEARDLHEAAFDMTYAWSWNDTLHKIAHGKAGVDALRVYYAWDAKAYQRDSIRMLFVSNHDKNAWEGTEYEQFGPALDAAIVLSVVSKGMPLVHNGQEAGLDKRLKFFDKDPIEWQAHPMGDFYRRLIDLRTRTTALWSGKHGAPMVNVPSTDNDSLLVFVRQDEATKVFAAFNLTPETVSGTLQESLFPGRYTDFTTGETVTLDDGHELTMEPWSYLLLLAEGDGVEVDPELHPMA
nr:alpha-amylase family glycosyl hydrolase [Arsenicicoccus piscis]